MQFLISWKRFMGFSLSKSAAHDHMPVAASLFRLIKSGVGLMVSTVKIFVRQEDASDADRNGNRKPGSLCKALHILVN